MFYIYILRNSKNQLYIGSCSNIEKRIERHNHSDGAEFTRRNKGPFNLVYSECYQTLVEARRREKQIKGWRREKKENHIKFGKPFV